MKIIGNNICAIVALSCVATGVMAKEIPAGTMEFGGGTELSSSSGTNTANGTDVDVDVTILKTRAAYYVAPNVGLGVAWNYKNTKISVTGTSSIETVNMFGAMATYNVSINEQMSIRPRVGFGIASMMEDPIDASGTVWGVGADVSYFPSDHVSFDAGVSYSSASLTDSDLDIDIETSGLGFVAGFTAYLR